MKGQEVDTEVAKSEGTAADGRALIIAAGAEKQRNNSGAEKGQTWLVPSLQVNGRPKVAEN